ncbi:hypothetical protein DIURU_002203 [Diutina rugosa]|uniref:Dolichyl-diphosphooligosaccharide-protein glycosyltransferase subunit OST5 n=1 Tax=Diutina rugosa TaxID=5481 RepID=A0A642UQI9_DIURU|nr:uncharacterized protein DIURU_002203 [Diutina rugosa]KAA8903692.1 hypothetical protein DIURU_002203 [Diutina rugosa]
MGESYEKYSKLFHVESVPVKIDNSASVAKTLGLLILAFTSLALMFVGDKKRNPVAVIVNAAVASLAVGLSAVYVSNFVGVYV